MIYENIAAGKYTNALTYPQAPALGDLEHKKMIDASPEELEQIKNFIENRPRLIREYRKNQRAYEQESLRLIYLFFDDLAEEYNMMYHSKRKKLENLAWEYGHSSGFQGIVSCYRELTELLK